MSENKYSIGSLEATLDVLEAFLNTDRRSRGVTEISRITGLHKARVFRILSTLESRGYIKQNPESQEYEIGLGFLFLGDLAKDVYDLRKLSRNILEDLAEKSGDSANLFILSGRNAILVEITRGKHILQAAGHIGEKLPLYASASPKLLLAYLPGPKRERILSNIKFTQYTEKTVSCKDELRKLMDTILSNGYSESTDDYELGMHAVAAPIRDHTGQVVAAISISVPQTRDSEERRERSKEMIIDAANRLSAKLGYSEITVKNNQKLVENTTA
jgi:DNA-binding IclR family transcriptional regulator